MVLRTENTELERVAHLRVTRCNYDWWGIVYVAIFYISSFQNESLPKSIMDYITRLFRLTWELIVLSVPLILQGAVASSLDVLDYPG